MSIHSVAVRGAAYLAHELGFTSKQESRMAFGLELLLGELVKLFCLLGLAWLLGLLAEIVILTCTAMILRLASGGAHCSEYYRCLIGGIVCFLGLAWTAQMMSPLMSQQWLLLTTVLSFLLAASFLWKYAPGDTPNKPITDKIEKKKFKTLSLIIAVIYLLAMILFSHITFLQMFVLPMALGMLEQVFTVTPWGYSFIHGVDYVLGLGRRSGEYADSAHPGCR